MDTHGEDYLSTQEGKNLPVKHCIKGTEGWEIAQELRAFKEKARAIVEKPAFGSMNLIKVLSDADEVEFVGLCTDIEPVNNMMAKLAILELSRGTDSGISSLEKELTNNYYFWANRREKHYLSWGSFTNTDRLPTIMKWYGVDVPRREDCTLCGHARLDAGLEAQRVLDSLNALGSADFDNLSLSDLSL